MSKHVSIYKDKNDDTELEIKISYIEMRKAVESLDWWVENHAGEFHTPVCDWCSDTDDTYYFYPELGHKVMCEKCAKEHKRMVKWYTEDLHPTFNSLISFIQTYDIGWSEEDYRTIDEFFSSKGHYSLHIKSFLSEGGK